jgi:hypothetical protein
VIQLLRPHEAQRNAHDPREGKVRRVDDRTHDTITADQVSALTGSSERSLM